MKEGEPKYTLERAQEEAELLKKKVESGEAKYYGEAEKLTEMENKKQELSPEMIEKIMEKVHDINESGTAYSSLYPTNRSVKKMEIQLLSVLKDGVLGGQPSAPREKVEWTKALQSKGKGPKAAPVFFNIIGRSRRTAPGSDGGLEKFNEKYSTSSGPSFGFQQHDDVTLLFDITKFKEVGLPLSKDFGEGMDRLNPQDTVGYEAVLRPYSYWAPSTLFI